MVYSEYVIYNYFLNVLQISNVKQLFKSYVDRLINSQLNPESQVHNVSHYSYLDALKNPPIYVLNSYPTLQMTLPFVLAVAVVAERTPHDVVEAHEAHRSKHLKELVGSTVTFPFVLRQFRKTTWCL